MENLLYYILELCLDHFGTDGRVVVPALAACVVISIPFFGVFYFTNHLDFNPLDSFFGYINFIEDSLLPPQDFSERIPLDEVMEEESNIQEDKDHLTSK
jgi:hypothetical protein